MRKTEGLILTACFLLIVVLLMLEAVNFAQHAQTILQAIECAVIAFVVVVVYAVNARFIVGR